MVTSVMDYTEWKADNKEKGTWVMLMGPGWGSWGLLRGESQ